MFFCFLCRAVVPSTSIEPRRCIVYAGSSWIGKPHDVSFMLIVRGLESLKQHRLYQRLMH